MRASSRFPAKVSSPARSAASTLPRAPWERAMAWATAWARRAAKSVAIGVVRIATAKPLFFDPYKENRVTGSFILIDPGTNATAGAGMINDVYALRRDGALEGGEDPVLVVTPAAVVVVEQPQWCIVVVVDDPLGQRIGHAIFQAIPDLEAQADFLEDRLYANLNRNNRSSCGNVGKSGCFLA